MKYTFRYLINELLDIWFDATLTAVDVSLSSVIWTLERVPTRILV